MGEHLEVRPRAVQAGDVHERLVGLKLAVGAAAKILRRALHAHGLRDVAVGFQVRVAVSRPLAGVLQGAGLLVGIHQLASERRAVDGLQLLRHVVERLQAVHREIRAHHVQAAARLGSLGQAYERGAREGRKPRAPLIEAALVADGPAPAVKP